MRKKWKDHVDSLVRKTGKGKLEVMAMAWLDMQRYGISLREYDRYNFYRLAADEKKIIAEEAIEKRQNNQERRKRVDEKYVKKVMKATGWTYEEAYAAMERSQKETGASFNHYLAYQFWNVDEEIQKQYFSKGTADALWRTYNCDEDSLKISVNKLLFCREYEKYLGRTYAGTEGLTLEKFKELFGDEKKVIVKPLDAFGGKGIQVYDLSDESTEAVYEKIMESGAGIVESFVIQHSEMAKLSVNAVNTVRIVTVMTHDSTIGVETGKVHFLYAAIRMGSGKSYVDNLHSRGAIAALDIDTGVIVTDAINAKGKVFQKHPDTGVVIKGFQVPFFQEAKAMVAEAGLKREGYLGWDVAITENGPVLIEINSNPGPTAIQMPYGIEKKGVRYMAEKYLRKE